MFVIIISFLIFCQLFEKYPSLEKDEVLISCFPKWYLCLFSRFINLKINPEICYLGNLFKSRLDFRVTIAPHLSLILYSDRWLYMGYQMKMAIRTKYVYCYETSGKITRKCISSLENLHGILIFLHFLRKISSFAKSFQVIAMSFLRKRK